jgi:PAS domain S-box-containing protein
MSNNTNSARKLITRDELFRVVSTSIYPTVITTYDYKNPCILFANLEHEKLTGYSSDELIGKNPKMFQGDATIKSSVNGMREGLRKFDSWEGSLVNYTKSGQPYTVFIVIFGISTDENERFYIAVKTERP